EGSDNVSVLLGTGSGSFLPALSFNSRQLPLSVAFGDFNGDGRADLAVADYNGIDVVLLGTANPTANQAGVGIFRSGFYWIMDVDRNQQFNNPPDREFPFGGLAGDVAVSGDWNGDGRTKVGIFRPSTGYFLLDANGNGQFDAGDKELFVNSQAGD